MVGWEHAADAALHERVRAALASGRAGDAVKLSAALRAAEAARAAELAGELAATEHPRPASLAAWLHALGQCAGALREAAHAELVRSALKVDLWVAGAETGVAYVQFATAVCAASGAWVPLVVDSCVSQLVPPSLYAAAQKAAAAEFAAQSGGAAQEPPPPLEAPLPAEQARVHGALLDALGGASAVAPASLQRLLPTVVRQMPHPRMPAALQTCFHAAMFRMAEHAALCPLRERLLAAAVDHLIALDVEVRWEDLSTPGEDDDEPALAMDDEEQFELDLEGDAGGSHGGTRATGTHTGSLSNGGTCSAGGAANGRSGGAVKQPIDQWANTLDGLMEEAFLHLSRRAQAGQLHEAFATLMRCFETSILPTYQSKFTQFLLFVAASGDARTCGPRLVRSMYERMSAPTQPSALRQAAAAYLGSYVARASYLEGLIVAEAVRSCVSFAVAHAREAERTPALCVPPSAANADAASHHAVFYASVQAALYALCYRLAGLMAEPHTADVMRSLPLQQLVGHPLAPLAGVMPDVADEFARLAAAHGLADCSQAIAMRDDLLTKAQAAEANKGAAGGAAGGNKLILTRFHVLFPFDPYRLKNSYKFVQDLYLEWPGGDDEGEDGETTDADTDREGDFGSLSQGGSHLGSLQQSVGEGGGMSLMREAGFGKMHVGTWRSDGGTASGGGTPLNGTPFGVVDITDPMALTPT